MKKRETTHKLHEFVLFSQEKQHKYYHTHLLSWLTMPGVVKEVLKGVVKKHGSSREAKSLFGERVRNSKVKGNEFF